MLFCLFLPFYSLTSNQLKSSSSPSQRSDFFFFFRNPNLSLSPLSTAAKKGGKEDFLFFEILVDPTLDFFRNFPFFPTLDRPFSGVIGTCPARGCLWLLLPPPLLRRGDGKIRVGYSSKQHTGEKKKKEKEENWDGRPWLSRYLICLDKAAKEGVVMEAKKKISSLKNG